MRLLTIHIKRINGDEVDTQSNGAPLKPLKNQRVVDALAAADSVVVATTPEEAEEARKWVEEKWNGVHIENDEEEDFTYGS